MGGRMDLAQAEAVMDVIRARTDDSRRVALSQLKGGLSAKINELRENLIDLLVQLEARIDFCEHDIPPLEPNYKIEKINEVINEARGILSGFEKGKIYREGIRVCIAGPPNVGKSTLLNTLLGEDRAIVTHIPGTTRDKIEETVNLKGVPLVLVDTAGLRETGDLVESIGIEKTLESINDADLTILVLDGSQEDGGGYNAIPKLPENRKALLILNKSDLGKNFDETRLQGCFKPETILHVSLLKKQGIEKIEDRILNLVFGGGLKSSSEIIISNVRHRDAIDRCTGRLEEARKSVELDMPDDFITIDLKAALDDLGEIVGKTTADDLIHRIFADFCIGK
jgi:tRNA modification GTPase